MIKKLLQIINAGLIETKYNIGIYNIMYNDEWIDRVDKILLEYKIYEKGKIFCDKMIEYRNNDKEYSYFEQIQRFIYDFNKNFKTKYLLKYEMMIIDNLSRMSEREIKGLNRIYNLYPKDVSEEYILFYPIILKHCIEWMIVSPIFKQIINYENNKFIHNNQKNAIYYIIKLHH